VIDYLIQQSRAAAHTSGAGLPHLIVVSSNINRRILCRRLSSSVWSIQRSTRCRLLQYTSTNITGTWSIMLHCSHTTPSTTNEYCLLHTTSRETFYLEELLTVSVSHFRHYYYYILGLFSPAYFSAVDGSPGHQQRTSKTAAFGYRAWIRANFIQLSWMKFARINRSFYLCCLLINWKANFQMAGCYYLQCTQYSIKTSNQIHVI